MENIWEAMPVDEYADFQRANGADAVKISGVWWRKVRPFFYQPLIPSFEAAPDSVTPPLPSLIGGYKHIVPYEEMANSRTSYFVWDDVREYALDKLKSNKRLNILKGLRHIDIRPILDMDEFMDSGYPVYLSFYSRTHYGFKKERVEKRFFRKWAEMLFRYPGVRVLGGYYEGTLCGVNISYLVEGFLISATYFSHKDYLKYRVTDVMMHSLRENAARCPWIKYIYLGPVTGIKSIDDYKVERGCRIISKPSYYKINPCIRIVLRTCMKDAYGKLTGR